jgi:hypothetical protein
MVRVKKDCIVRESIPGFIDGNDEFGPILDFLLIFAPIELRKNINGQKPKV